MQDINQSLCTSNLSYRKFKVFKLSLLVSSSNNIRCPVIYLSKSSRVDSSFLYLHSLSFLLLFPFPIFRVYHREKYWSIKYRLLLLLSNILHRTKAKSLQSANQKKSCHLDIRWSLTIATAFLLWSKLPSLNILRRFDP